MDGSLNSSPWPSPAGLSTIIVPRGSAILSIAGSARIRAPASFIFSIVLDTAWYPHWNTFCPRATIHSQPTSMPQTEANILHKDTSFTFHVVMDPKKPDSVTDTKLRVTDISTPEEPSTYVGKEVLESDGSFERDLGKVYRVSWTTEGGFVARGLRSERFHEVLDLGEEGCEVRTWECQGGMLARVVKSLYKNTLQAKFGEWCQELKTEAERRVADGKTN